jgi:hypothetical protein
MVKENPLIGKVKLAKKYLERGSETRSLSVNV